MSEPILQGKGISKSYGSGESEVQILKGIDIQIQAGEALCISGASGAGKSTLLHILGTLDSATAGSVFFEGEDLSKKAEKQLADFRNRSLGFVFQFHHLLSEFTALENIEMPARIAGQAKKDVRERSMELAKILGINHRTTHYPSQLSGGEQQRVAIARALMQNPRVLLADEPTGNLDATNGRMIQDLFFALRDRYGLTLVVVTHDNTFASRFPRRLHLVDGRWN